MTSLRGPDGSPSDPDDLVGSSGSALAPTDPLVKKPIPGPLAWSDDVLLAVSSVLGFPEPTPEEKAEAQWEDKVVAAIESGAIGRKKPGRKPGESKERDALVRAVAQACLDKAGGRSGIAKQTFIERVCAEMHIGRDRADNLWYEVTEAVGRTRRVL